MHGFLDRKQTPITCVVSDDLWEGAPEPRVRVLVVGEAVGSNHRSLKLQNALEIFIAHLKIDGAGRLQTADSRRDVTAHFVGNVVEVARVELRVRF